MNTGSLLVASIATMGAFVVVAVVLTWMSGSWPPLASTGAVAEFGANSAMLASEHAGGMAPLPGWIR